MPTLRRKSLYQTPAMELLDPVVTALLEPEQVRLKQELRQIIANNQALGGTRDAFFSGGKLFSLSTSRVPRNQPVKPLHESLVSEFELLQKLSVQLSTNTTRLRQSLSVVLPMCRTKQEIRDLFPDALAVIVPDFRGIDRVNPEGFLHQDNPMLHTQFQKAIDIALYYTANRLIY